MIGFRTTILKSGKSATGIEVPAEVIDDLGSGRKPPVRVTIGDHTYRSTVASRGGRYLIGVSAVNREAAGVAAGDTVDVGIELDTEPRDVVVPSDFAEALSRESGAKKLFESLSYSQRRRFVDGIEGAKKPETRRRRIDKAVAALREGRAR